MRSIIATLLVAAAVLSGAPQAAAHGDDLAEVVSSEVLFPTRFADTSTEVPNADGGYPGLGRRLWLLGADNFDGVVARVFDVYPETWGGRFDLTLNGDLTGSADLGIYFYSDFGDAIGVLGAIETHPAVTTGEYDATAPGGESGAIPMHADKALVFMKAGLQATFTYTGYTPASVAIGATGFDHDVTVPAGGTVTWRNDDVAFHGVRSDALDVDDEDGDGNDSEPLFDTSPKPTQPLVEGASFTYRFMTAGTYGYTDPFTGTRGQVIVTGVFGQPAV